MMPTYNSENDVLLQEMHYNLYSSAPALKGFHDGKVFAGRIVGLDRDRMRLLVQACGVAYERDDISLVPDAHYDAFAHWLGDAAATAMDWETYPPEAGILANKLIAAQEWRKHYLEEGDICMDCPWSWNPENICECRWEEMLG